MSMTPLHLLRYLFQGVAHKLGLSFTILEIQLYIHEIFIEIIQKYILKYLNIGTLIHNLEVCVGS